MRNDVLILTAKLSNRNCAHRGRFLRDGDLLDLFLFFVRRTSPVFASHCPPEKLPGRTQAVRGFARWVVARASEIFWTRSKLRTVVLLMGEHNRDDSFIPATMARFDPSALVAKPGCVMSNRREHYGTRAGMFLQPP